MVRPKIAINLALSADGKISNVRNRPADWTSPADKQRLRQLRQNAGALLVGRGTWNADQMKMRVRDIPEHLQPLRCIISRSGDFDSAHPIFQTPGGPIHLISTGKPIRADFGPAPVHLHHSTLPEFLETLATHHHIRTLHCEGGGQLIRELAALDAIDDVHLTLCGHTLFGGAQAPTATGLPGLGSFPSASLFQLSEFHPHPSSGECFLSYTRLPATTPQWGVVFSSSAV